MNVSGLKNILVYDEDNLLQEFMKEHHRAYAIETNLQNLPKRFDKEHVDILILVEKEHPDDLFALLAAGRLPTQIVYCAKHSIDARSFRRLKQDLHVHYVLQQPLDKQEFNTLLEILCSPPKQVVENEFLTPNLRHEYEEKMFDKLEQIEDLMKNSNSLDYKKQLLELRNVIHKLTGNAALYGFPEISKLCGEHEKYLYSIYAENAPIPLSDILKENESFFRKLKLFFQKICINNKN